jgi:hypothetical protein
MAETKATDLPIATIDGIVFHPGGSYHIKDRTSARLYKLYNELVRSMDGGLLVSRTYPPKVAKQHDVQSGGFIWMTTNTVGYDRCVNPTNISMLHMAVMDFLRSTKRGVLHSLNDKVTVSHSLLLVTIDEHTVEPREMRVLEKDFERTL